MYVAELHGIQLDHHVTERTKCWWGLGLSDSESTHQHQLQLQSHLAGRESTHRLPARATTAVAPPTARRAPTEPAARSGGRYRVQALRYYTSSILLVLTPAAASGDKPRPSTNNSRFQNRPDRGRGDAPRQQRPTPLRPGPAPSGVGQKEKYQSAQQKYPSPRARPERRVRHGDEGGNPATGVPLARRVPGRRRVANPTPTALSRYRHRLRPGIKMAPPAALRFPSQPRLFLQSSREPKSSVPAAARHGAPDRDVVPPLGALRAQGGGGEGLGVPWRSSRGYPEAGDQCFGPAHKEGEHVGGHPRAVGGGVLPVGDLLVAVGQEDPPQGHGGHHWRVVRPRPGHGEGPSGDRQVARHHGLPRLPQGVARGQGGGHGQGQLHHRAPGPGLPGQRPAVRQERAAAGDAHRRGGLQRRRLPAHRQGAVLHRRRLRDERRRQPPRPLPPRPRAPQRPPVLRLPLQAPHHRRLHHREHEHAGGERAAEGEPGRPAGARRRAERRGQLGDDRRRGVRRRQGVQGQQGVQHADDAGVPPPVPRGDGRDVRVALPGLHRHHGAVPGAHPAVPAALPAVPEVHHQGVRLRGRGREAAGAGGERPQPHQVRRLLELEQEFGVLREPALRGGQRRRQGQEALGDQREARRLGVIDVRRHGQRRQPVTVFFLVGHVR